MRRAIDKKTVRLERIENIVADGIPDVLSIANGFTTFCELKQVAASPVRATTRLIPSGKGLRLSQRNWHMECFRHGGRSLIIVGVGVNKVYCLDGGFYDSVNTMTEAQMKRNAMATDWKTLEKKLKELF